MDCIRHPSHSLLFNGILYMHPVFFQTPLLPSEQLVCLLSAICSCSAIQMWALKIATCREFKSCSRTWHRASKYRTWEYTVRNELDCLQNNPWLCAAEERSYQPSYTSFPLQSNEWSMHQGERILYSNRELKEIWFSFVKTLIIAKLHIK